MDERDLSGTISRVPLIIDNRKGVVFYIGDRNIFVLYEADLDEGEKLSLEQVAEQVGKRFEGAIAALIEQGHGTVVVKGVLFSLLATVVMFALLWGIQKATTVVLERLQQRIHSASAATDAKLRWAAQGWLLVKRVAQLVLVTLWLSVAYLWFTYVLANFPLTQPFAERLSGLLIDILEQFAEGAIASLPGLLTVAIREGMKVLAVTLIADPARFDLRGSLDCGADVSIDVGCVFEGRVDKGRPLFPVFRGKEFQGNKRPPALYQLRNLHALPRCAFMAPGRSGLSVSWSCGRSTGDPGRNGPATTPRDRTGRIPRRSPAARAESGTHRCSA